MLFRHIKDISIDELYLWFCGKWHLFQKIADGKVSGNYTVIQYKGHI